MIKEVTKGFKFRIYPNKEQEKKFELSTYAAGLAWNRLLGEYVDFKKSLDLIPFVEKGSLWNFYTNKETNPNPNLRSSFYFQDYKSDKWKTPPEKFLNEEGKMISAKVKSYNLYADIDRKVFPFNEVSALIISEITQKLGKTFDKMKTGTGFPKFKKLNYESHSPKDKSFSFTMPYTSSYHGQNFKLNGFGFSIMSIPTIKNIKIKIHKPLPDEYKICNITISKNVAGQWFAAFCISYNEKIIEKIKIIKNIGVDRNIKHNVVCTSDEDINNQYKELFSKDIHLVKLYNDLKKVQIKYSSVRERLLIKYYGNLKQNKSLSDDQKSSTFKFLEKQISKLNTKIVNYRNNKNWNIAKILSDNAENVIFENLNLKGMTKRAKDKGEGLRDGTVKRKSGLNRNMLRSALGDIKLKTSTKITTYEINPRNTSLRCSCCGHISKDNRLTQEIFKCVQCNHEENADFNASKNILQKHLEIWK